MRAPVVIDFETYPIRGRPDYPPAPVGVAIKYPGRAARYYAWGHPTENNTTKEKAGEALRKAYAHRGGLLFHNCKFDLDVAEVHFGIGLPNWDMVHETMFLVFLDNPYAREVGLKPAASHYLGLAPDERDAVSEWLIAHQPVPGVRITKKTAGAYIAYAPGGLVGEYAIGDVVRTEGLFDHLFTRISERGMGAAYDRERKLIPILLDMERRGIRVDLPRLRRDVSTYDVALAELERWVRSRLGVGEEVNLDSGAQLVEALVAAGEADVSKMGVTAKEGRVKTDKNALAAGVGDPQLAGVLRYVAQLKTCLGTFMKPWLEVAERSGGYIYTNWNQIRGGDGGTRTGRFSSTPNWQNIPTEFGPIFNKVAAPFTLPELPLCRGYIIPYEGHILCGRDFASQELRILAHFEDGPMMQRYIENPEIDFHTYVSGSITQLRGAPLERKYVKIIGFSILYGAGVTRIAAQLGKSISEAGNLLDAYFQISPGIKELQRNLKYRGQCKEPIKTVGGRQYFVEPSKIIDGRQREFSYKLLNYLIQGSAADITKDAMLRFYDVAGPGFLLASVHDELLISVPLGRRDEIMTKLKFAMEETTLDVAMLSDGEWGFNWGAMEPADV